MHGRLLTHRSASDAWKPRCRCGWQGPLSRTRDEAARHFEAHVRGDPPSPRGLLDRLRGRARDVGDPG